MLTHAKSTTLKQKCLSLLEPAAQRVLCVSFVFNNKKPVTCLHSVGIFVYFTTAAVKSDYLPKNNSSFHLQGKLS
jgi:hypothetical protein